MKFEPRDAEFLLGHPEFRRFLFVAIQSSGILGHTVSASSAGSRDLGHLEGRRALGFDILDDGACRPERGRAGPGSRRDHHAGPVPGTSHSKQG